MGLLNPLNLLLGLSLAALVAIYLRSQARPTLEVSSLMLFEEAHAPAARSRILRVDLLFWLEAAALAALTLVAAGFYVRTTALVSRPLRRALIFDLGVSMQAVDPADSRAGTRLQEAQRLAREITGGAPAGEQFSLIAYALEARLELASTGRKPDLAKAIGALRATAVGTRAAALRAAMNRAGTAEKIDLFTDRIPDPELVKEVRTHAALVVHRIGHPVSNLAVVTLEPGTPKSAEGRCIVRNFAYRPRTCRLTINLDDRVIFDSPLMIEPRAVTTVRFGPLPQGGVLHAHLSPPDGLAADNDRYALAPANRVAQALVVSPEGAVRDDLARILLAANPALRVTTVADAKAALNQPHARGFDLAVFHDTNDPGVVSGARLLVFPPVGRTGAASPLPVLGTMTAATLQSRTGSAPLAISVPLGATRLVDLPGWMDPLAQGAAPALTAPFPLAATGYLPSTAVGLIAFDVRDHLLLDPDRIDALLLVIDTIRRLVSPTNARVATTGELVVVPTFAATTLIAPDGTRRTLAPDRWGRVSFRPVWTGGYRLAAKRQVTEVYANYYDEAGSDLTAGDAAPERPVMENQPPARPLSTTRVVPFAPALAGLAVLIVLLESALLAVRARRWGFSHV